MIIRLEKTTYCSLLTASKHFSSPDCSILSANIDFAGTGADMPDQEWIKTLADGRRVKFVYQELLDDGAFLSAQIAGHEVVYSVILEKEGNALSRDDVE